MDSPADIALADKMNAGRREIVSELKKLIVGQDDVIAQAGPPRNLTREAFAAG